MRQHLVLRVRATPSSDVATLTVTAKDDPCIPSDALRFSVGREWSTIDVSFPTQANADVRLNAPSGAWEIDGARSVATTSELVDNTGMLLCGQSTGGIYYTSPTTYGHGTNRVAIVNSESRP